MAASPQTLTEAERRLVASWAADCADRMLHVFETEVPGDSRPRDGIERARAFGRGELGAAEVIRQRFEASRAAAAATGPAAKAAVWAAGQASAVAHMAAHALGAAAYAAKAASLGAADAERARRDEVRWQLDHMTPQVRAALARLPVLGEDPSGPLGKGLLTTGALAATIRDIQDELRSTSRSES